MKTKLPVAVLGATGMVGQRLVQLLHKHPLFKVSALGASPRSSGRPYGEAVRWKMETPLPTDVAALPLQDCSNLLDYPLVFSGLPTAVAAEIEERHAQAGCVVVSNSGAHRMRADVPLIIPEVNSEHLALVNEQPYSKGGKLVTNPNCAVIGLALALKPLQQWGIEKVHVVTQQALSGAGYPGVSAIDCLANVIPYIGGEEPKVEAEPRKIFGELKAGSIIESTMQVSATCTRVPVIDGHLAAVSVSLKTKCTAENLIEAWETFSGSPQRLQLPSAPEYPLLYEPAEDAPQPRRHLLNPMSVSIGRLRPCPLFQWKFMVLSHNTVRGAAGAALLNAELMEAMGYLQTKGAFCESA